eukprot:845579-Pleurochrysis_carterae.AAC.1
MESAHSRPIPLMPLHKVARSHTPSRAVSGANSHPHSTRSRTQTRARERSLTRACTDAHTRARAHPHSSLRTRTHSRAL